MLAEALAWLGTPASTTARRLGHLAESIAIAARHRRCRTAWAPHLAATRKALLASAQTARSRRIALVLGSGHLLDVPLAELAALYREVWLVDMVQPWPARLAARKCGNVRLIEADVTAWLGRRAGMPSAPDLFLDEAAVDWVASVNLLSQLAPARLGLPDAVAEALMRRHLDWLVRFHAPACLVCDLDQTRLDAAGAVEEYHDFRSLLAGWRVDTEWRWDLAPTGELAGGGSAWHRVAALRRQGEDQDDIGQAQGQVGGHQGPDAVV